MPEEIKKEIEEKQPDTDIFGTPRDAEPVAAPKEEEGEKKKEDPKGNEKTEDIENHPLVKELRSQLDAVRKEYGGNLSGQREVIKTLETKLAALEKGSKKEEKPEPYYKEIKRSKDLSKAEREEMTETELRQMDAIADMQEGMNRLAAQLAEKDQTTAAKLEETGKKVDEKLSETEKRDARNEAVRTTAMELAENDKTLANQIIEAFNLFDQSKVADDKLAGFVRQAAALVPDYKPPKEQGKKHGSPVKGGKNDDPFGVDQIVEEVHNRGKGNYAL